MAGHATNELELPEEVERQQAKDALLKLAPIRGAQLVRVRADAKSRLEVVLPERVFNAMLELLRHTAEGNAVTLVPVHAELTTQQAADLLNVSRPHLIKLLDEGALPFHRTGRHRRVYASDLLAYRESRRAESTRAFEELAQLSQAHDLGY